MRTADEIVARLSSIEPLDDFFGATRGHLLECLTYDQAQPFIRAGLDPAEWSAPATEQQLREQATGYLGFAWGKIEDHRGLSAGRSVDHYRGWLWLLMDDTAYAAWEAVDYPQYGAPMIAAAATYLGAPIPEGAELQRMIAGQPCSDDCYEGCGE